MAKADDVATALLTAAAATRAPIEVETLAKAQGALIVRQPFEHGDVSGMLLREADRVIIGVNSTHSSARQRFTIAHELGHLKLHPGRALIMDTPVRVNFRDRTSSLATDREEMEANRFAAALLMPADLVVAAAQSSRATTVDKLVDTLAHKFRVSRDAMSYRLINLGILS